MSLTRETKPKHRTRVSAIVLALLLAASPPLVLAGCGSTTPPISATYTVTQWSDVQPVIDSASNGDVIDMSSLWSPDVQMTFKIPANRDLKLVGHAGVAFIGVAFDCGGNNKLTIDSLSIWSTNNQASSALHFSGRGNLLTVEGRNAIAFFSGTAKSGFGAGIGVGDGVELTIGGSGYLEVAGLYGGAAIGGGLEKPAGSITFAPEDSFYCLAFASEGSAAIGGGSGGNGAALTIDGGTVNARAGLACPPGAMLSLTQAGAGGTEASGAAIGGGSGGTGGSITINGGTVIADSSGSGAAIGGGVGGAGGSIAINGGNIRATNHRTGPAIGGGVEGDTATISMRAGTLTTDSQGKAINASFSDLPGSYHWYTHSGPQEEWDTPKAFPGDPYIGSETYKYVRIEAAEILRITVEPGAVDVARGSTQPFTATVTSSGGANSDYRWSISGHLSTGTYIDSEGLLSIAANESADTITVVATSAFDNQTTGEATVTVVAASANP